MKKIILVLFVLCFASIPYVSKASTYQGEDDYNKIAKFFSDTTAKIETEKKTDEEKSIELKTAIESQISYITAGNTVKIANGKIELKVPDGYVFVPKGQALFIFEIMQHVKNNEEDNNTLEGLLSFNGKVFDQDSGLVYLNYSDDGHVSDNDASSIDGDKMISEFDSQNTEENKNKGDGEVKYENTVWLTKPHYDSSDKTFEYSNYFDVVRDGKVLHSVVNSYIMMFGRTGALNIGIATKKQNMEFVSNVASVMKNSIIYTEGNRYSDYNSITDKKSDSTIGKIAAGAIGISLLSKLGAGAVFLKIFKIVAIAVAAVWVKFKFKLKKVFGKKDKEDKKEEEK